MDLFEALQISALKSVIHPDDEYFLRRIFRWYSEKYHTPLHTVEDLPLEDVLQTYFECSFEHMSKRKLNSLAKKLTNSSGAQEKPKKPRKSRKKADKKVSDDDFIKQMQQKSEKLVKELEIRREEVKKAAQNMMESLDDMDPLAPAAVLPEIDSKFNNNLE